MRSRLSVLLHELLATLILTLVASGAFAAPATTGAAAPAPASDSPWRLGAAVGYGQRSNPLALSEDLPIVVDLDIAWFGENFFFDNGDVGLTLRDDDAYTINFIGRINSDRVFFSLTDSRIITLVDPGGEPIDQVAAVPDRDFAIEAGLELLADGTWGFLQFAAHHDVSNTHGGYELYANYGYGFRKNRWLFEPSFGVSYKSSKLNDYYWGVRPDEANVLFQPYTAGAGLNRHARVESSYHLDTQWSIVAILEYERLNPEASASPITDENHVRGAYVGMRFIF